MILSARNLTVKYGENTVISGANFEVAAGDFVCVVGANGSGKSTLVKTLLGLIKPASGKVIYGDGISRGTLGYLPQETRLEQNFPATVSEIVLSGTLGRGGVFYSVEDRLKAEKSMKRLGIFKLRQKSFMELSGGQKQKVLLARALTATSELLVLDEPSNNLDQKSRKEFYEALRKLNAAGLTILMITHDLDADDLIGNKVLALRDGAVKMSSTREFLRSYR